MFTLPSVDKNSEKSEIKKIVRKLENLPTIPTIAAKILKTLTEENPEIEEIVKLIETDQATTMKILKLVNSAHFSGITDISSVQKAVVRLGFSEVRCVLLSVTISESLVKSLQENGPDQQDGLWKHSLACAVCAEMIINKTCPDLRSEAFVSGLLHDVGKLILEECFPDKYMQMDLERLEQRIPLLQAEQNILGVDHTIVGKWLAEEWNLPEVFVHSIWLHHIPCNSLDNLKFVRQKKVIKAVHLANILVHDIMSDSRRLHHPAYNYKDLMGCLHLSHNDLNEIMGSLGKAYSERTSILNMEENASSFYYHSLQRANQKLAEIASNNKKNVALEKVNQQLTILVDLNLELSNIQDTEIILKRVQQTITRDFMKCEGAICFLDITKKKLMAGYWHPEKEPRTISAKVDERGQPNLNSFFESNDRLKSLIEDCCSRNMQTVIEASRIKLIQYCNPYLVIPLIFKNHVVGGIGIIEGCDSKNEPLTEERLKTYGYMASITETALSRATLIERLRDTAESLTKALSNNEQMIIALKKNTTEKTRMEQDLIRAQKFESIGVLSGGIAHDFNNILTAISGNISLAKMYLKPEEKAFEKLIQAEKAFLRAKDLTGQLLTFSKNGKRSMRKTITSIGELIKDSAEFAMRGSNVRHEFIFQDNLFSIEVDEGQFNQVITNLLINADQAMPQGGVIRIEAENIIMKEGQDLSLKNETYVKITINDQGTGVSKEDIVKIFDPYFTTKKDGSGLGLATVYSIIKNHKGHIDVESEPGVGTTFYIYLPASTKEGHRQKDIVEKGPITGKGMVLIMDNEKPIRDLTGEMLESLGYEVKFASNGSEVITSCKAAKEQNNPFDVVILDLTIPGGMGGRETIQKLHEIAPDLKVIVSSGYVDDPVMLGFREYGFSNAVAKPYEIKELSIALHGAIMQKQTETDHLIC